MVRERPLFCVWLDNLLYGSEIPQCGSPYITVVYVPIDSVSPFVTAAIWCFVVHSRYHAFPAKEFNTCLQVFR